MTTSSRYIPLTQQPYCCVPTCIQMVMYKEGIPLLASEAIGEVLGLTVPPKYASLFATVQTAETPPLAGYGTRIYEPEYEPNDALEKLGVPLHFDLELISTFPSSRALASRLAEIADRDKNALVCFNQGALTDEPERDWGHVCVFDRINKEQILLVDPSPQHPKIRVTSADNLFAAMLKHGDKKSAGIWVIEKV